MKKCIWILLVIGLISGVYAQESTFSIELNYPIAMGSNFVGDNYTGIADLGIKYRFVKANPVDIGVSFNGSVLTGDSRFFEDGTSTIYTFQPSVFGEFNFKPMPRVHPFIGVGYTFVQFEITSDSSTRRDFRRGGLNFMLGVSYDLSSKFFVQVQYV